MNKYQASIKTPFAHLGIRLVDNRLAAIDFIHSRTEIVPADAATENICERIRQYLDDPGAMNRSQIPCAPTGTAFQKSVWNELKNIPAGQVVTYGDIAQKLGTSARAVGNACRKNPIPVVVPCHRVVSAGGIGGYAGASGGEMLAIKSWLLQHEGAAVG